MLFFLIIPDKIKKFINNIRFPRKLKNNAYIKQIETLPAPVRNRYRGYKVSEWPEFVRNGNNVRVLYKIVPK